MNIGDKYQVIANSGEHHFFPQGSIVTLEEIQERGSTHFSCEGFRNQQWLEIGVDCVEVEE